MWLKILAWLFPIYRVNIDNLRIGELPPMAKGLRVRIPTPNVIVIPFGSRWTCDGNALASAIDKGWIVPFWKYEKTKAFKDGVRALQPTWPTPYDVSAGTLGYTPLDPNATAVRVTKIPDQIGKVGFPTYWADNMEALVAHEGGPVLGYVRQGSTVGEIESFYKEFDDIAAEHEDRLSLMARVMQIAPVVEDSEDVEVDVQVKTKPKSRKRA